MPGARSDDFQIGTGVAVVMLAMQELAIWNLNRLLSLGVVHNPIRRFAGNNSPGYGELAAALLPFHQLNRGWGLPRFARAPISAKGTFPWSPTHCKSSVSGRFVRPFSGLYSPYDQVVVSLDSRHKWFKDV